MKLAVLHLSDLHINGGSIQDYSSRIDLLVDAIKGHTHEVEFCLCLITGDIAFRGMQNEYDIAKQVINALQCQMEKYFSLGFEVFAVPGNHDCNFEKEKVREAVLASLGHHQAVDSEKIEFLTEVQENFFEFSKELSGFAKRGNWDRHNLCYVKKVEFGESQVELMLLNSAWCSRKNEQPNNMFVPIEIIKASNPNPAGGGTSIRILATHHPFNWMHPDNGRELRREVEPYFDMFVFGHEHQHDVRIIKGTESEESNWIDGGMLFGKDNSGSKYNLILLDQKGEGPKCITFALGHKHYAVESDSKLAMMRDEKKRSLTFNHTFEKHLKDPGANFTHRNKQDLTLDDIFVCPTLQRKDESEKEFKKLEELCEFILTNQQCVITGVEKAGKTALAKSLCQEFHMGEHLPIMVKAQKLLNVKPDKIKSAIENEVIEKYEGANCSDRYLEKSKELGILLIDGFNSMDWMQKQEKTKAVLKKLKSYFHAIVILMSEDTFLDCVRGQNAMTEELLLYEHLEILPLSFLQRHHIIEKWNRLGTDNEIDRPFAGKITDIERTVDQSLGRDLVPSYPLFVLTIIQSLEANIPHRMPGHGSCGSFGYIYETLITRSLVESTGSLDDVDTSYNYLSELAYHMYSESCPKLPIIEYEVWHTSYNDKFMSELSLEKMKKQLLNASLLEENGQRINFKYKYIYCYFVAHYMNQHITEKEVRDHVKEITGMLYNEQAAIIVMFLCHLSMDAFLLDNVLKTGSRIFANFEECTFNEDIKFLGDIYEENVLPKLPEANECDENRHKLLKAQDQAQKEIKREGQVVYPTADSSREHEDEFEASQVNASFKTIQLLGQILRNFQGKMLKERKQQITETCFSLVLRTVSSFLHFVHSERKDLLEIIERKIQQERPELALTEVKIKTQKYVFSLSEFMVLSIMKHCSDSIGFYKLSRTFDSVFEKRKTLPNSILALSIKLDNHSNFPIESLEKLYKPQKLPFFAQVLIRHLVWLNLYLYPIDYHIRQRIGEIVDIDGTKKIFVKSEQKLLPGKKAHAGQNQRKNMSKKEKRRRKRSKHRR